MEQADSYKDAKYIACKTWQHAFVAAIYKYIWV